MSNQNLNFASHIRIISDTAQHYAKSGTNYTICFQSAFLYALSALAHKQEAGKDITGKWGLVFHKPCCVKEIPPEEFELSETRYEGVLLHDRFDVLRPKYEITRRELDVQLLGDVSYSVIMARKFELWTKAIQTSTRISTPENRAVHESLTATFVNLTEFVHLNCDIFFRSYVYYNYLFNDNTLDDPDSICEDVLTARSRKTAHDVLIDSLAKCGLVAPWTRLIGRKIHVSGGRENMRGILAQTLSHLIAQGWKRLVIETSWLTPEDSDATHVRASYLLHRCIEHMMCGGLTTGP